MKKLLLVFVFFSLTFCSDDQGDDDQEVIDNQTSLSDHLITTSNEGKAYSLLMTSSEYNDWKNKD